MSILDDGTVLVTGATGLIGTQLIQKLNRPIITSRNAERAKKQLGDSVRDVIEWDGQAPMNLEPDLKIDAVINLMGDPIAKGRWNSEKKSRIRSSRVEGTRFLVQSLEPLKAKPTLFISTSAVGLYGSRGDIELTEDEPASSGYLAEVCAEWEAAADEATKLGIKVCKIRVGLVCSTKGGVIAELAPKFRWGLGAKLGNGKQYVPWIHINDIVGLFLFCLENQLEGAFNGTAPNPVTNREFTRLLAAQLRRPAFMAAPKFTLKLMLGEFADSLFASQRAIPTAAIKSGFKFEFESLDAALADLLATENDSKGSQ